MKSILLLPVLILSGCAYYQPIGISSSSVGSQYERPTGLAEGVSRRWMFFPCYNACPVGDDSLKSAMDKALAGKPGDALVNVYAERKTVAFPFIYFPLIVRSDIVVTGTVVKYIGKEFPPDNEAYLYSNDSSVIWAGLLALKSYEQMARLQTLQADLKAALHEYSAGKECAVKDGSLEATLFQSIIGRKPMPCPAYRNTEASTDAVNGFYSNEPCKLYYCMTLLTPKGQVARIAELKKNSSEADRKILADIVSAGQKRIRACRNGRIFVNPEEVLNPGEQELLTHLCEIGDVK